jgi:uncharacterized protein
MKLEKLVQTTQKLEQKTIEEMLDVHPDLLTTNIEAWAELLAEDSVVEFPYTAALLSPTRLEGKVTICNHVKAAIAPMQNLTFTHVRKYLTTDPHAVWAEMYGEAIIPFTGRQYQQEYVVRLKTRDGKLVRGQPQPL